MSEIELCECTYPRCIYELSDTRCDQIAWFNFRHAKKGIFCSIHRMDGMIDLLEDKYNKEIQPNEMNNEMNEEPNEEVNNEVNNKMNEETMVYDAYTCTNRHCFSIFELIERLKDRLFKKQDKTPNCMVCDCTNPPLYNYMYAMLPMYCKEHKHDEMVLIKPPDVYVRTSEEDYIYIQPSDYRSY